MKHPMLFFRGFRVGFLEFGHAISGVVNTIALSLVYALGVGPTSLVAKIVGKKFLDMDIKPESDSYWHDLDHKNRSIEDAHRQF